MTQQLFLPLIGVAVNIAGLWLIYSLMAHAVVQLRWHGRGLGTAIILILVAELFWILPASFFGPMFYLGNSIATAAAVIILSLRARAIPPQLKDTVRMDGLGLVGVFWKVILPYVRRELLLIMLLALTTMVFPIWVMLISPDYFESHLHFIEAALAMPNFPRAADWAIASLVMALLPIVILLLARQDRGGLDCEHERN